MNTCSGKAAEEERLIELVRPAKAPSPEPNFFPWGLLQEWFLLIQSSCKQNSQSKLQVVQIALLTFSPSAAMGDEKPLGSLCRLLLRCNFPNSGQLRKKKNQQGRVDLTLYG